MFYLYKKTHAVTGLQYLGYTKKDPLTYKGSGTVWLRHLKVHGNHVNTDILSVCESKDEIKTLGRYYSDLWEVVESTKWANLKAEEADGGDMRGSEVWVRGRQDPTFKHNQSLKSTGNTNVRGKKWWNHPDTNELRRSYDCPGIGWQEGFLPRSNDLKQAVSKKLTGRVKTDDHKQKLSDAAKGRTSNNKGTVWVVDRAGKRRRVLPNNIPDGFELLKKELHEQDQDKTSIDRHP